MSSWQISPWDLPPSTHPYIAVGATVFVFAVLQLRRNVATDLVFMFALVVVTLCGVISPDEALRGFASPAPLTVAGLLAVAAGLRTTGVLDWVGRWLLGSGADRAEGSRASVRDPHCGVGLHAQHGGGGHDDAGGHRLVPAAEHFSVTCPDSAQLLDDSRRRLHAGGNQHDAGGQRRFA